MHVAFYVEKSWCDDLLAALADPSLMEATLDRWWERAQLRLDAAVVGGVRLVARRMLDRLEPRIAALRALNAPQIVLDAQQREIDRLRLELDPANPRAHTGHHDLSYEESRLPLFVEGMLKAAQCDQPSLGLPDADPERIVLGRVVESISYAFAGDLPGPDLDPRLAALLSGVKEGLVSFCCEEWDPLA